MQDPYLMENKSYLNSVEKFASAQGKRRHYTLKPTPKRALPKAVIVVSLLILGAALLSGVATPLYAIQPG